VKLHPAPENFGVVFKRVDLPGSPEIRAMVDEISSTNRSTNLGLGGSTLHTVEHFLAALYCLGIDNVLVEVDAGEMPVGDGSSLLFLDVLRGLGTVEQEAPRSLIVIAAPVFFACGDSQIVALPADEYRISYTLHYDALGAIGTQFADFVVTEKNFVEEIAPCRTFALHSEVEALRSRGLIKGGSLDNAIVVQEGKVANPKGLRFDNELARHKLLDVIGDLSLLGSDLQAHIIAIRSGHSTNFGLASEINKIFNMESQNGQLSYTY
jgi:UDP-3-O-[3-hydroxymyristoyl] N-acetylglucosamine deacetylase